VSATVDPLADIEVINMELSLADLDTVSRALERAARSAKSGDKEVRARQSVLERVHAVLDAGRPARMAELDTQDRASLGDLYLLTLKPVLYIANVAEDGLENNPLLDRVKSHAAAENAEAVAVCAAMEAEIAELDDADKAEFLESLGLAEPGLNRVIRGAYRLLGLETYLTAGPKEVRAWTVKQGSTAPEAAAVIHTDFQKGFIRAEVIAYADFIQFEGESGAREAGRWRLEGKDYVVKEGDVIHFRFNV
jgi:GTP-binding protein YchF